MRARNRFRFPLRTCHTRDRQIELKQGWRLPELLQLSIEVGSLDAMRVNAFLRQVGLLVIMISCLASGMSAAAQANDKPLVYQMVKYEKEFTFRDRQQGGASVTFEYPEFIDGADDSVLEAINYFVKSQVPKSSSEKGAESIDQAANTVIEGWYEFASSLDQFVVGTGATYTVSILLNSHGLLCLHFRWWSAGGAHPIRKSTYFCLDTESGRVLQLDDLLVEDYERKLTLAAELAFRANNNLEPEKPWSETNFEFDNNQFHLPENFAVDSAGLLFHYNEYEIAAYVYGEPKVRLGFGDFKALIPPAGLLHRLSESYE